MCAPCVYCSVDACGFFRKQREVLLFIIILILVVLGLCCVGVFSSCSMWGLLFVGFLGFSLLWLLSWWNTGSRCVGFSSCGWQLSTGSVLVAHGLSCSSPCRIFPDQGLNPCSLHWQADCYPLYHQQSPVDVLLWSVCSSFCLFITLELCLDIIELYEFPL